MGSPGYISPEQVNGKRGDARSDVFALGVMLYEMLAGTTPFDGPNAVAIMNSRLVNDPVPLRMIDPAISPQVQRVIRNAMARDPEKRYETAKDLAYDLEHLDEVSTVEDLEMPAAASRRMFCDPTFLLCTDGAGSGPAPHDVVVREPASMKARSGHRIYSVEESGHVCRRGRRFPYPLLYRRSGAEQVGKPGADHLLHRD